MGKNKTINVKGTVVTLFSEGDNDFISLTDIAKHKDSAHTDSIIQNWLRNRNTIELLGFGNHCITPILNPSNSRGLENKPVSYNPDFNSIEFDGINNQNFKVVEFDHFKMQAGLPD